MLSVCGKLLHRFERGLIDCFLVACFCTTMAVLVSAWFTLHVEWDVNAVLVLVTYIGLEWYTALYSGNRTNTIDSTARSINGSVKANF